MPLPRLRHHARSFMRFSASPPRLPVAVKAAVAMGLPLAVGQATGHLPLALQGSLGAFTILYGPTTPGRFRARLMGVVGLALVLCAGLGGAVAGHAVLTVAALVVVAVGAVFFCQSLVVGPPGAYFFPLVVGVGNLAVSHGQTAPRVMLMAAVGASCSFVVGMSDLLWDRHGPERRAVADAERAVSALASATGEAVSPAHATASLALHRAWTAVTDGGSPPREVERLSGLQHTYAEVTARRADGRLGGATAELVPLVDDELLDVDLDADAAAGSPLEQEQLRDTALGRPAAGHLVRSAVRAPCEVLLVVRRVALAATLAGVVTVLGHQGHAYWAVAVAVLVLHQGGTREGQTLRGVQRALGTVVGLALFLLLEQIGVAGWGLVLAVTLLQLCVELLVTRNYAAAVTIITPLALLIGTGAAPGAPVARTVGDRLVDTLVGVACAMVVLWSTGRRRPELVLRAHARRVVHGVDAVLGDLAEGDLGSEEALEHRRHLYHDLLDCDTVARRSEADAPGRVEDYRRMERTLVTLGYLVLGACWHPELRQASPAFAAARQELRPVLAVPVTQPRPAEQIEAELRAVERAMLVVEDT